MTNYVSTVRLTGYIPKIKGHVHPHHDSPVACAAGAT